MPFSIRVNPLRFEYNSLATGPIWLQLDNASFPFAEWNDFPVIILAWWLNGLLLLLGDRTSSFRGNFMDGPYYFELSKTEHGEFAIQCFRTEVTGDTANGGQLVQSHSFCEELLAAAKSTIEACDANRWTSSDLETLRSDYEALRHFYKCREESSK